MVVWGERKRGVGETIDWQGIVRLPVSFSACSTQRDGGGDGNGTNSCGY